MSTTSTSSKELSVNELQDMLDKAVRAKQVAQNAAFIKKLEDSVIGHVFVHHGHSRNEELLSFVHYMRKDKFQMIAGEYSIIGRNITISYNTKNKLGFYVAYGVTYSEKEYAFGSDNDLTFIGNETIPLSTFKAMWKDVKERSAGMFANAFKLIKQPSTNLYVAEKEDVLDIPYVTIKPYHINALGNNNPFILDDRHIYLVTPASVRIAKQKLEGYGAWWGRGAAYAEACDAGAINSANDIANEVALLIKQMERLLTNDPNSTTA